MSGSKRKHSEEDDPMAEVRAAMPDPSESTYEALELMLRHWENIHEEVTSLRTEVQALRAEVADLKKPEETEYRNGGPEAVQRAVRFMWDHEPEDVYSVYLEYVKEGRTKTLELHRSDDLVAVWMSDIIAFEVPGLDTCDPFPSVVSWISIPQFEAMALSTLQRGRAGWSLKSVGYNQYDNITYTWKADE